jgi:hypothetical protein
MIHRYDPAVDLHGSARRDLRKTSAAPRGLQDLIEQTVRADNRDASTIRRLLTETHVAATDRRAIFVGAEAYTDAGGTNIAGDPDRPRSRHEERAAVRPELVFKP